MHRPANLNPPIDFTKSDQSGLEQVDPTDKSSILSLTLSSHVKDKDKFN